MDARFDAVVAADETQAPEAFQPTPEMEDAIHQATVEYLGRWNRLVSTTNWEKGRIIAQWRVSLADAGLPAAVITDEAFAREVGGVTPQHVGRLRRVYQRFGDTHEQFGGLFWSHFHAALDWDDADMWLEGAVQNGWSVAGMREQRWEAQGGSPEKQPRPEDIFVGQLDEDVVVPVDDERGAEQPEAPQAAVSEERAPRDAADVPFEADAPAESPADDAPTTDAQPRDGHEPVRPFAALPELPADLAEALESFKLAILNHKVAGWKDISRDATLEVVDALRQLILAP